MLSKFYLQNWRWVFSSTLDLNQTTAKETTSSFSPFYHYIYYCIGILKLHSLFIPCHHHPPFADSTLLQPVFMFFPTCNVFAKGRLRSESRHEDHHVIRLLWYYVCWNCLSTRKRKKIVAQKTKNNLAIHALWCYTQSSGFLRMYFTEFQIVNEGLAKTQIHHAARNDLKRTDFLKKQK